jgi:hypothetical protein
VIAGEEEEEEFSIRVYMAFKSCQNIKKFTMRLILVLIEQIGIVK